MNELANQIANLEAQREFAALPLEIRLRNCCPGCGCRLVRDNFVHALEFVKGPPKTGSCLKCGWAGTK